MHAVVVLPLVTLLSAHVPGMSQGDVAVDDDGRDVTVEVDAVFARGDAARLPDPFVVVTAGGDACEADAAAAAAADVEGDGRALRMVARCDRDGDVVVDVVGLRALPPEHRMALRVVDDAGARAFLLMPGDTAAVVARPRATHAPSPSVVVVALAAVVVACGARTARALAATLGLALVGAGVALLARPFAGAAVDGDVVAVVRIVAAMLAVAAVAIDPAPRVRVVALAIGALTTTP